MKKQIILVFLSLFIVSTVYAFPPGVPPMTFGTLTNGKVCIYTTGTGVVCNSDLSGTTFASQAEVNAGTVDNKAVAPDTLGVILATKLDTSSAFNPAVPGAIGETTPNTGKFTTISAGGGGFSVDADGDVEGKSFSVPKVDGVRKLNSYGLWWR